MVSRTNDTQSLPLLFHLNSEPWINEEAGTGSPFVQKTKSYSEAARIEMPPTTTGQTDQFAMDRRSTRAFRDTPLPFQTLASLLRSSYSTLGPDRLDSGQNYLRRPVPSAGGLYPLEIYALVRNVEGLAKGIYHYNSIGDDLEVVADGAWEGAAKEAFLTWSFVEKAPVILCIGAVFERTLSKYGPRGYRYILLEAGHVAQNLCLVAGELGLGSLCLGGFRDGVLNNLLLLDGLQEAAVYSVAAGLADTP
jgi:SagB-type dehydrogenase family enzyme